MLRISTTTLEAFRRVLTTEYATEAELVAQVKGEPFKPTWQMEAGTAWDRIIERPVATERDGLRGMFSGAFRFGAEDVCAARDHIGPGVWQAKATKQCLMGCRDSTVATIVAQADHCRGLVIQENKAKFSTPYASDYEQSLQWRFYLWVHGAARVRYNLFDFSDPKSGYCELRNIISFSFWDYPGLEADCLRWVRDFIEWAASKSLLGFLDRESRTAEAA